MRRVYVVAERVRFVCLFFLNVVCCALAPECLDV